ncbi:MAG: GYF domain-containing protein [Lentisphaeria bacterium]|nr:GYF domain-containing protein [Lentisphaeria bacterium]
MNWHYVDGNGDTKGPISENALGELIVQGAINKDTHVWNESMEDWTVLRNVNELQHLLDISPAPKIPADYAPGIQEENTFQRSSDPFVLKKAVNEKGLTPVGEALQVSMEAFKASPGILIGSFCLMYIINMAAGQIPFLNLFLMLQIIAVFAIPSLLILRGQTATVNDGFVGFKSPYLKNMTIGSLIAGGIMLLALCLTMVPLFAMILGGATVVSNDSSGMEVLILLGIFVMVIFMIIFMSYTNFIAWMMAILMADRGLIAGEAFSVAVTMVKRNYLGVLIFTFVIGFIAMVGLLALCVGFIFTGPISFMCMTYAYEFYFKEV